ncbi:MAG: Na+/H+ antiporter NhaA [Planctomycetota bacterium]|jgi:NhaA family Na+:H+ antiporter
MSTIQRFLKLESLAGIALLGAAVLGMLSANSPLAGLYDRFVHVLFEIRLGDQGLSKPLLLWINDGLMAVFFLLVALELKREVLDGELSRPSQIALPLAASIGGIVVPAGIYILFTAGDREALLGWAIPAATDIAFALGVLAMLGGRVSRGLKTFLLTLAVFDDIGAILIIAVLYTQEISWAAKGLAVLATVVLVILNRVGVTRVGVYLCVGAFLWVCVLKSGVHATLAGVIVGLSIPHRKMNAFGRSPLKDLEHMLHPWVAFFIIPVFAFANSGVSLAGMSSVILHPVALGIIAGLVVGKMVGVFAASALLIRRGWADLPEGASWASFFGVCILAGIGFTMSLFIGTLAFEHTPRDFGAPLRLGVLVGSLISAVAGYLVLRRALRGTPDPAGGAGP